MGIQGTDEADIALGKFIRNIREHGLEISNIHRVQDVTYDSDVISFTATIKGQKKTHQDELLRLIRKMEGVKYLEGL